MKTNISQFILISGLLLLIGCSTTDRMGGRFSPPEPKETKEYIATIQITCVCPTHENETTGAISQEQSCGAVKVQGEVDWGCLPYSNKVPIKSGEYLKIQYLTTNTNQHKIFVRLSNGVTYREINSGTVSLLRKIP